MILPVVDQVCARPSPTVRSLGLSGPKKHRQRRVKPTRRSPTSRAGQTSQLYNLTLDINALKQQLYDLALRRELLTSRAAYFSQQFGTFHDSALRTVAVYFEGFARGYYMTDTHQRAMVESISDNSLSLGVTGLGVGMLMEQWRRYTEIFSIRHFTLHSMRVAVDNCDFGGCVVKCDVSFEGSFTQKAVTEVFPGARQYPHLLLRALGRRLVCPMMFHLYFNSSGKLVRHDVVTDFFSGLCNLLKGDAGGALSIVDGACVGEESMVGPDVVETQREAEEELDVPPTAQPSDPDARHSVAFLLS